jgi:hypothetical protein
MAFRIPLLTALLLGASLAVQAQTTPAAPEAPKPAAAPTKPASKAAPKDAPKKTAAKPVKKTDKKADAKKLEKKAETPKSVTYSTGPTELRDKQGNVIPTDPAAYPIDSALPKKK